MVSPCRAAVKPRVVSLVTGETLLLEDVVESQLEYGRGAIEVVGPPASGKTAALAHLASLDFARQILLLDMPCRADVQFFAPRQLVVYTTGRSYHLTDAQFMLARWSSDDLAEYLLAAHPRQCQSVMARLAAAPEYLAICDFPALVCMVADRMAADGTLTSVRGALRQAITDSTPDPETLEDARFYAVATSLGQNEQAERRYWRMAQRRVPKAFLRLLNNRLLRDVLAADRIVMRLKATPYTFPTERFSVDLVREIACLVREDAGARHRLSELAVEGRGDFLPMVASILCQVNRMWRPRQDFSYLFGAYLSGADWRGIELKTAVNLRRADLRHADLRDAKLENAWLEHAHLDDVRAARIRMPGVRAHAAGFNRTNLTEAVLWGGSFHDARFRNAVLDRADASEAVFLDADFTNASLRDANLRHCSLRRALLENTDLRGANLAQASLAEQVLTTTLLDGANLEEANLGRCDLEYVVWPEARLRRANLTDAHLTGSRLPRADLREARLLRAGLADVDWEGADLREADLRQSSFHLGSTRSGLVGSPYPCHGTRTGFYTNDYDDQWHKAPEEIRKANLCGADLRGAKIFDVDFYLVDVRGAKYDAAQERHLRRCDAILESRVV